MKTPSATTKPSTNCTAFPPWRASPTRTLPPKPWVVVVTVSWATSPKPSIWDRPLRPAFRRRVTPSRYWFRTWRGPIIATRINTCLRPASGATARRGIAPATNGGTFPRRPWPGKSPTRISWKTVRIFPNWNFGPAGAWRAARRSTPTPPSTSWMLAERCLTTPCTRSFRPAPGYLETWNGKRPSR